MLPEWVPCGLEIMNARELRLIQALSIAHEALEELEKRLEDHNSENNPGGGCSGTRRIASIAEAALRRIVELGGTK